jgi:hypothetical protein
VYPLAIKALYGLVNFTNRFAIAKHGLNLVHFVFGQYHHHNYTPLEVKNMKNKTIIVVMPECSLY